MTESGEKKNDFKGCCPGWDFQFPMNDAEKMSEMMKKCCTEGGSFDCTAMMEMFKDEDGDIDVGRMMKMMKEMIKEK